MTDNTSTGSPPGMPGPTNTGAAFLFTLNKVKNNMRYSSLSLLVASVLAAGAAHADFNNSITFNGTVSDQTCTVKIDGQDNAEVKLPTVSEKEMKDVDSTAGDTPFVLTISDCSKDNNVSLRISKESVTEAGHVKNSKEPGYAEGYAVRLLDDNGKIDIKATSHTEYAMGTVSATEGVSKTFIAQYVREKAGNEAVAGSVKAVLKYELTYK